MDVSSVGTLGQKARNPAGGIRSVLCNEFMHSLDLACPTGDDGQLGVESLQIELAYDTVVGLLHQKHP
jgi:hypothetical protein